MNKLIILLSLIIGINLSVQNLKITKNQYCPGDSTEIDDGESDEEELEIG